MSPLPKSLRRVPLVLTAVVAAAAPAAAQAASTGINVSNLQQAQAAAATGAEYARVYFNWNGSASAPDPAELAYTDKGLSTLIAAGVKPIMVVTGRGNAPTRATIDNFAAFMGALARYYSGRVYAFEAWNEPDEEVFWGRKGGDPALYASLLKAAYPLVSPYARMFVGGMTGNNYKFLEQVYDFLGGSSQGAFDGVAVHTDFICGTRPPDRFYRDADTGRISQYGFLGIREIRQTMVDHGDAGKPIWMTEIGWSTSKAVCDGGAWQGKKDGGVSERQQAEYLSMAYHCLKDYPYVEAALWYDTQDVGPEVSLHRFGLLRTDGTKKPAYAAFEKVVAGQDVDAGRACGDFTGPTLSVLQPADNAMYVDLLGIQARASDPSGIMSLRFLGEDGKAFFGQGGYKESGNYPAARFVGIDWRDQHNMYGLGPHTITVEALDGYGNPTTRTIPILKVDPARIGQLPVSVARFKVKRKGRRVAVAVRFTGPSTTAIPFRYYHKVRVYIQKRVGRRWRQVFAQGRGAKNTLKVRRTLSPGTYRAYGTFMKKAPFKGRRTKAKVFTVR